MLVNKVCCSNKRRIIKQHKQLRWRSCSCGILTPAEVSRSWAEMVEKALCCFSSLPVTQMQNNPQNSYSIDLSLLVVSFSVSWLAYSSLLLPLFLSVTIHIFLYLSAFFMTLSPSLVLVCGSSNPLVDDFLSAELTLLDIQCHRRESVFVSISQAT